MEHLELMYDICDAITEDLEDANAKIKQAGGKLSRGDVDYIDKLTHALKSIKTVIAMEEAEGEYSSERGNDSGRMYSRAGRGRSGRVKRDAMGRYSGRMYSRDGGGVREMLEDAMREARTDRERDVLRRAMTEMER